MDRVNINVSRDNDLRQILIKFDMIELVDNGSLNCDFCGETVTWDNLAGLVTRDNKKPLPVCYSQSCIEEASRNARC